MAATMSGVSEGRPGKARLRAIEFFSGIGAFAAAAQEAGIEVVAAFDQSQEANLTYRENFGLEPRSRNLDTLAAGEIPTADLWWMSPPCTPFTVRGKRRDDADPRAASFLNLIALIPKKRPGVLLVENVRGFLGSRVHDRLLGTLCSEGYAIQEIELCPTRLGVPMLRPRRYLGASLPGATWRLRPLGAPGNRPLAPLAGFLDEDFDPSLRIPPAIAARHGRTLNVVGSRDPASVLICFTWGYGKNIRGSGSVIRLPDGGVRRVSPEEIVRLLGFPKGFHFPAALPTAARWRLAGNSVDVRAIRFLMEHLAPTSTSPALCALTAL